MKENQRTPATSSPSVNPAHNQTLWPAPQRQYHINDTETLTSGLPNPLGHPYQEASISDLRHLTADTMENLCHVWFKEYQPWCPILDRNEVNRNLQTLQSNPSSHMDITLKALISLTVSHSSPAIILGYDGRERLSRHLRRDVHLEAEKASRISSLQALLILIIYHYGYGHKTEAQIMLSMCRRMCFKMGLEKYLASRDFDWHNEGSRVVWLTAAMESTSTLGAPWDRQLTAMGPHITKIPEQFDKDVLPQSLIENLNLTVFSLHPVHEFHSSRSRSGRLQELTLEDNHLCDSLYHDLARYHQQSRGSGNAYAWSSDGMLEFDPNKVLTNIICTTSIIALYQPYTMLPHNLSLPPSPDPCSHQTLGATAAHRCLEAANDMSRAISSVADTDIEFICPFLGSYIFTAARFALVYHQQQFSPGPASHAQSTASNTPPSSHSRSHHPNINHGLNHNHIPTPNPHQTYHPPHHLPQPSSLPQPSPHQPPLPPPRSTTHSPPTKRSTGFDLLMHALNMCGRRWPLSRRLDIVLRAALVEESQDLAGVPHGAPGSVPALPREFYDLNRSGLEIDDALAEWVEGMKSSVYVGSLNGPYA